MSTVIDLELAVSDVSIHSNSWGIENAWCCWSITKNVVCGRGVEQYLKQIVNTVNTFSSTLQVGKVKVRWTYQSLISGPVPLPLPPEFSIVQSSCLNAMYVIVWVCVCPIDNFCYVKSYPALNYSIVSQYQHCWYNSESIYISTVAIVT